MLKYFSSFTIPQLDPKMTASDGAPFDSGLALTRRAHARLARRAAAAWLLLNELSSLRVHAPRTAVVRAIAEKVYYSGRCDVMERYESIEEFEVELSLELDSGLTSAAINGTTCYVIRPFFASRDSLYLFEMGLSGLRGCELAELTGLDVAALLPALPLDEACAEPVTGLLGLEAEMLARAYRAESLKLINLLRKLATALTYVRSALTVTPVKDTLYAKSIKDPGAGALVGALSGLSVLPFLPAPCTHFGTEADRVNPLRRLTVDMEREVEPHPA